MASKSQEVAQLLKLAPLELATRLWLAEHRLRRYLPLCEALEGLILEAAEEQIQGHEAEEHNYGPEGA